MDTWSEAHRGKQSAGRHFLLRCTLAPGGKKSSGNWVLGQSHSGNKAGSGVHTMGTKWDPVAESGQSPRCCTVGKYMCSWTLAEVNETHVRGTNQNPGKEPGRKEQYLARSQDPH